jgi:predicted nucleotidyltransferase
VTPLPQDEAERVIADAIQAALGPVPVILAGSRATGEATATSDYDVCVVLPTARIPFSLRKMLTAAKSLEQRLGVPVTVNPVPQAALSRRDQSLFAWKLASESKLLAAPSDFSIRRRGLPRVTRELAFSYLSSACFYLLEPVEPADLASNFLSHDVARGVRKALLHIAQLELIQQGKYESRLEEALQALEPSRLHVHAQHLCESATWFAVRGLLVDRLGDRLPQRRPHEVVAGNLRHAAIAALRRGPGWRAALARSSRERQLASATILLLSSVSERGDVGAEQLEAARRALPGPLRPRERKSWKDLRDVLVREWANAHPLVLVRT